MESVQFGKQVDDKPVTPPVQGVESPNVLIASESYDDDDYDDTEEDDGERGVLDFSDDKDALFTNDDPDGSEEEDEGYEDDDEADDDSDGFNANFFMAKSLKKTGDLPDDFEIPEDISYDQVFTTVRERIVGQSREEGRREGLEEIRAKYSEEDLLFVRGYRLGADPAQFNTLERMRQYGALDLTTATEEQKMALVHSMHTLRGMDPEDASILVSAKKDQLDALAAEAKTAHGQGFAQWKQNVEAQDAANAEAKRKQESAAIAQVNEILTTRQVGQTKMSPEQAAALRRDLFEAHETLVVEGKSYPVTAVNKFLHEFQNSAALQLELYMLRQNKDLFIEKTRKDAADEVEAEMRKSAKKVRHRSSKKSRGGGGSSTLDGVQFRF